MAGLHKLLFNIIRRCPMNDSLKSGFALLVIFLCWACFILPSAAGTELSASNAASLQLIAETIRSSEVLLGPEVHWQAPAQAQDLFKTWNFDQEAIGGIPTGFSTGSNHKKSTGGWRTEADPQAPTTPHVMTHTDSCPKEDCFQVLLANTGNLELPDIVVSFRQVSSQEKGEAGIVLAAQDPHNFYAVTVNLNTHQLSTYRVQNGKLTLLGKGPVKPKAGEWHVLRVQVVNSAHVDFPRLELFLDGREIPMAAVYAIHGVGRIGLITKGEIVAKFDGLRVIEMVANRPFSKPAAY
jgi:hypothetical protein